MPLRHNPSKGARSPNGCVKIGGRSVVERTGKVFLCRFPTGNQSPANIPAKGKYLFADFARFAKRYGVKLNRNPYFPINTLLLMRIAIVLQTKGDARFPDYCNAVFTAIWVESLNMNDPAIAAEVIRRAGFDPQALIALAGEQTTKDALKAATQAAVDRGIFGAPTFFVGDQMFWGQDRMDFVKEALQ